MLKSWLLYALGQIAKHDSRDVAYEALRGCDPLVATLARRRLVQSLHSAEQASGRSQTGHVARIASFTVARLELDSNFDDLDGVASEYTQKLGEPKKPRSGPWLTLGLVLTPAVLAAAAFGFARLTRPFSPSDSPTGKLFADGLTPYAVALAQHDAEAAKSTRAAVRVDALKPESQSALTTLLDRAEAILGNEARSQDAFRAATNELNRSLESAREPYYVATDLYEFGQGTVPTLLTFYVQQRGSYAPAEGKPVDVIRVWRLDHLNIHQSLLGYTQASEPRAVILLDQIEEDLVTQLLPAAAPGALMSFSAEDLSPAMKTWEADLQRRSADILRQHYAKSPPEVRAAAEQVGTLLAKRRSLLAHFKELLSGQSLQLRMPRRLVPEADYAEDLEHRVPRTELEAWNELHAALLSNDVLANFELVREAYVRSVERHEVQHRLDYSAARFVIPELLAERLGLEDRMGHDMYSRPMRAATELSAYLAQMAEDDSPLLAILSMTRLLFTDTGSAHSYAALAALEGTARALGIDTAERLGQRVTREEIALLLYDVCAHDPNAIKQAARKAYQDAFGESIPTLRRGEFVAGTPWRH